MLFALLLFSVPVWADKDEVIIPDEDEQEGIGGQNREADFNLDGADLIDNGNGTGDLPSNMPSANITIYKIPSGTWTGNLPADQYIIHKTLPFRTYAFNQTMTCGNRTYDMYTIEQNFQDMLENMYCSPGVNSIDNIVVAMTYDHVVAGVTTIKKYPYQNYSNTFTPCSHNYMSFEEMDHTTFYYNTLTLRCNQGLERSLEEFEVSVYPNPAKDLIRIESNLPVSGLSIYDSNGKKIMDISENLSKGIDVSAIRPGVYHIRIESATEIKHERVVILD